MFTQVSKTRKALSRNQRLAETRLMEVKGGFGPIVVIPTFPGTSTSGNQKPDEKLNLNFGQ